jgi:excisionase family DNA binding protein
MTTAEAAILLERSESRVRRLCEKGLLVATKHGRDWWIEPSEIERFKVLERPQGWKKGRNRKEE